MELSSININWFAVLFATAAYSIFSGMWHRPFAFGKHWEAAMGFTRPEGWKETSIYFIVPSISCLLTAIAISVLSDLMKVDTINDALLLGLIIGIGIAATVTFTNAVLPIMKKPLIFGAITGTAHVIGITLVSVIIFLMR